MKICHSPLFVIPLLALSVSGCDIDEEDIFTTSINADNAEKVARFGLDMMDVGSISKDVAEYVRDTNPADSAVSMALNCIEVFQDATGTLTVTGSTLETGNNHYSLDIVYNDCQEDNLLLSGSVSATSMTVGTTKTKSVTGSLSATKSTSSETLTLNLTNFSYDKVSDTTTNPENYTKTFDMVIDIPLFGNIGVNGSFSGTDTNIPDNPTAGLMTVSASGSAQVTPIDNLSFSLSVDPEDDGSFGAVNNANDVNLYAW